MRPQDTTASKTLIADRRQKVAEMYLRGMYQSVIAEDLGCDQATISRDLTALRREWLDRSVNHIEQKKAEQLAKIDRLEVTYWNAWERSKENAEVETVEQIGVKTKTQKGVNGEEYSIVPERIKKNKRTEGQLGNPAFLQGVQWCINKRCEILGLDAPKKQEHTGKDGAPMTIKVEYVNTPYPVADVSSSASGDTAATQEV